MMLGRKTDHHSTETTALRARGGVTAGGIATGIVVAQGAMLLLSAIIAAVLVGIGLVEGTGTTISAGEATAGTLIGTGIAFVVAQFLAYMWGGYTAARMSRGAGLANGLLVPLFALLIFAAVAGITAFAGASELNSPFAAGQLPFDGDLRAEWGLWAGIAFLAAMFLGGALGGMMGHRWHRKLEDTTLEREHALTSDSHHHDHETHRHDHIAGDGHGHKHDDHTIDITEERRRETVGAGHEGEVREVGGHTYRTDQNHSH